MDPVQSAPLPVPPKKDYTLVVILSITTLLATLIAFFFYFQNQQLRKLITVSPPASPQPSAPAGDPIADWKTYTNSKYGFSFKYPAPWTLEETDYSENKDSLKNIIDFSYQPDKNSDQTHVVLQVSIQQNIDDETKKQYMSLSESINYGEAKIESVTINKKYGIITENPGFPTQKEFRLFSTERKYIISLEYMSGYYEETKNFKTFDQILFTFKFTEPQSTPSASPL